jgi:hypothetical protein
VRKLGRWLRWLAGAVVSAATPLPWLVDVTSPRFEALEQRVTKLERQQPTCWVTVTRDTMEWLAPPVRTTA